jgi:hypothetical protein
MCLYFNRASCAKVTFLKNNPCGEMVTRYKVVLERDGRFFSPIQKTPILSNKLVSDRPSTLLTNYEASYQTIHQGIHVFITKDNATDYSVEGREKVYPVKCYTKDLVMISSNDKEEVYTEIEFLDLFPQETEYTITTKEKKMEKMNWSKVLSSPNAQHYLTAFATGQASGSEIQEYLSTDRVGFCTNIRNFVRQRGVAEARRVARKALRRRGVQI